MDEVNRNAFMVRVFFSSHIGIDELYFQVQKRLREYKKEYQALKLLENNKVIEYEQIVGKDKEVLYWKIVLSRGFYDTEAKIRWAEETLDYLEKINEAKKKD